MKKKCLLFFCCLGIFSSIAQNNNKQYFSHDVGVFLGASYYIGDLNNKHFFMSQPAIGLFYRFNYSYRIAFKAAFNYGSIQGDDSQSSNPDQLERNLNFKTKIMEFSVRTEFNFWEYRTGHKDFIFAPYIFIGIGVFNFNPQAHYQNQWVSLKELSTEGEGTPLGTRKPYPLTQVCLPFGIGFKLTLSQQIGLGFEWGPRKTFTDYLDDVSGTYVDPAKLSQYKTGLSSTLSNTTKTPGGRADDVGKMRGNPNTKDWYFYYGLVISFKLKSKPKECRNAF
ncbi:MAG TPA: DUF6089 family protein [Bacteroidia bacterium]|jgi:hypothetical protein|nr:DUF6089 family protein [Bacteroidia bacterium]